jgi:hypothetical protein
MFEDFGRLKVHPGHIGERFLKFFIVRFLKLSLMC